MLFRTVFHYRAAGACNCRVICSNIAPPSAGTLSTHKPLFITFLIGTVILVGVLTYVPALALRVQ